MAAVNLAGWDVFMQGLGGMVLTGACLANCSKKDGRTVDFLCFQIYPAIAQAQHIPSSMPLGSGEQLAPKPLVARCPPITRRRIQSSNFSRSTSTVTRSEALPEHLHSTHLAHHVFPGRPRSRLSSRP
jgi:hypothetical protein